MKSLPVENIPRGSSALNTSLTFEYISSPERDEHNCHLYIKTENGQFLKMITNITLSTKPPRNLVVLRNLIKFVRQSYFSSAFKNVRKKRRKSIERSDEKSVWSTLQVLLAMDM